MELVIWVVAAGVAGAALVDAWYVPRVPGQDRMLGWRELRQERRLMRRQNIRCLVRRLVASKGIRA